MLQGKGGRRERTVETALFVRDLGRTADFYQDVLGLDKLRESDDACVFTVAKRQLLLLISEEKARTSSQTHGGEVPPCVVGTGEVVGAGHVAFAVAESELEAWRSRLQSHGVELLNEASWEPGGRSLYFRAPDGHLLELATPGVWDRKC